MSLDALGLFLFGVFSFLAGKDHNNTNSEISANTVGEAVFCAWAFVGCFSFLFDWFSFQ